MPKARSRSSCHVDNVLHALGAHGKYQIRQALAASLICLGSAYQLLSNIFTCRKVTSECARLGNETDYLLQFSEYTNVTLSYGQCSIHVKSDRINVFEDSCIFGYDYELSTDASAVSQFGLVCEKSPLASLSQTLVIVGQAFGAVSAPIISDRVGRKPLLIANGLALMVSGIAIAYAPNYSVFAVFKFFVGAAQMGAVTAAASFMVELFPGRDRRLYSVIVGIVWSFCCMSLAGAAYLLRHQSWRTMQMVFSLSSLPVLFAWWYLDESIRWLFANGKYDRVKTCLKRAAKLNNKNFDDVIQTYVDRENYEAEHSTGFRPVPERMSVFNIFKNKRLLVNSIALWFGWFTAALGYFALYLTSSSLSGNRFLNYFLIAFMELPNNIFFYFALNRLGRRLCAGISFATLSVGLILTGVFKSMPPSSTYNALALLTSLVSMLGASSSFGVMYAYTPELFPTNIRNQALGLSSFIGRLGGMLAPFTSVLADQARWGPGVLIGCLACLVCVGLSFLPETRHRELPQTVGDLESWYKKKTSKSSSKPI